MRYLKIILLSVMMAFSSVSFAASGLTADQETRIKQIVDEGKKTNSEVLRDEAQEWSKWGRNMGLAIVGMTKELGVAVENFSKTDVGKITIVAMVIKFMGPEMLSMVTKILAMALIPVFAFVGLWSLLRLKKQFSISHTEYKYVPVLWGMFNRRLIVDRKFDRSTEDHEVFIIVILTVMYGILLCVSVGVAF